MKVLIILCALALPAAAQDNAAIEKAILEVNTRMTQAGEARDIDRLFSYMLPNAKGSIVLNGNLFLTREAALSAIKAGARSGAAVKYRWKNLLVTVISPTTALLVAEGESEIRPAPGDAPIVAPFAQSILFVLTDGQWRALHAHQSATPAEVFFACREDLWGGQSCPRTGILAGTPAEGRRW